MLRRFTLLTTAFVTAVVGIALWAAPTAVAAPSPVKLMSWNIGPPNEAGTAKWQGIIDSITYHNPDVIALQEVHEEVGFDQVAALRAALPQYVDSVAHRTDGNNYNMIMSKAPIHDVFSVKLPNQAGCSNTVDHAGTGDGCPVNRGLVGVTTAVGGVDVRVYTTHLTAGASAPPEAVRGLQMDYIAQHLKTQSIITPLAIMGDFNLNPQSAHLSKLAGVGLYDTISAVRDYTTVTFPITSQRLDYAWVSPALDVIDANASSTAGVYSDHRPVISSLVTHPGITKVAAAVQSTQGWANVSMDTGGKATLRTCDGVSNPYGVLSALYNKRTGAVITTGRDNRFGDMCETKAGLSVTVADGLRVRICRNNNGVEDECVVKETA